MWVHHRRVSSVLGEDGLSTFLMKTGIAAKMQASIKNKSDLFKPEIIFTSSCADLSLSMFLHLLLSLSLSLYIYIYAHTYIYIYIYIYIFI